VIVGVCAVAITRGQQLAEEIEREIRRALPHASLFTHLEPLDEPVSQDDIDLDR
jgi:divalent metal cation (Fe/Co/Zn/Cd) transporter